MCMYMWVHVHGAYRTCAHVVFACTRAGVCGVYRVCVCVHEYIVCACMCMSRACVCVVCNGGEEEVRLAHRSLYSSSYRPAFFPSRWRWDPAYQIQLIVDQQAHTCVHIHLSVGMSVCPWARIAQIPTYLLPGLLTTHRVQTLLVC